MEDQLFVSKYLLKLPDKKALENIQYIERGIGEINLTKIWIQYKLHL